MPPLSARDLKWVEAIVDAAAARMLGKAKDFTAERIETHIKSCPHFIRGKGIIFGLLLASSFGGGGAVLLSRLLARWLGG